jgi:hypothetical protein
MKVRQCSEMCKLMHMEKNLTSEAIRASDECVSPMSVTSELRCFSQCFGVATVMSVNAGKDARSNLVGVYLGYELGTFENDVLPPIHGTWAFALRRSKIDFSDFWVYLFTRLKCPRFVVTPQFPILRRHTTILAAHSQCA